MCMNWLIVCGNEKQEINEFDMVLHFAKHQRCLCEERSNNQDGSKINSNAQPTIWFQEMDTKLNYAYQNYY